MAFFVYLIFLMSSKIFNNTSNKSLSYYFSTKKTADIRQKIWVRPKKSAVE